jgi:hypothetical protein
MSGTRNTPARTRLKSVMIKTVTSLIVAAGLALFAAPAAMAAPVAGSVQTQVQVDPGSNTGSFCSSNTVGGGASSSTYLPINRWNGSSSVLHTLQTGGLDPDTVVNNIRQQGIVSGILNFGNSIMSATSGLTSVAVTFCPMELAGGLVDQLAGTLGSLITTTPLGVLIIAVVIVSVAISTIKSGLLPLRTILAKGAILGLLAVMVNGAMLSQGAGAQVKGGAPSTGKYEPGKLSPGWFLTQINDVVGGLASGPAAFLTTFTPLANVTESSPNTLSCNSYVAGMHYGYSQNIASGGISDMKTGVPFIINGEFEQTGMRAWRTAQFGSDIKPKDSTTNFDDQAWCRILEWNSGAVGATFRMSLTRGDSKIVVPADDGTNTMVLAKPTGTPADHNLYYNTWHSKAFVPASEDDKDRSLLAWSACLLNKDANGAWNLAKNWTVLDSLKDTEKKIQPEDCADWMTNPKSDLNQFQTDTRFDYVNDHSGSDPAAAEYINTIHGNSNGQAAVQASFSYPIAALSILLSFGSVAAGVIVAKALMMVLIIAIIAVLIAMLLPGRRGDKVMQVFSMSIGMTLFVFGAQLIFSLLALLAAVISSVGGAMLGGMDLLKVLWVGLSPLMAAAILSYIFKMVGLPNPLSIKGALDWGNHMSRGGGGAMFAGASSMLGRQENKVKGAAQNAVSKSVNAVKGRVTSFGATPAGGVVGTGRKGASVATDEKGAGGRVLNAEEQAIADIRGDRKLTRAEQKVEDDAQREYDADAKAWAEKMDPSSAVVSESALNTTIRGAMPGFAAKGVIAAKDRAKDKAMMTASIFQQQGIGAGLGHIAGETKDTVGSAISATWGGIQSGLANKGKAVDLFMDSPDLIKRAVKATPGALLSAAQAAPGIANAIRTNAPTVARRTAGVVAGAVAFGPLALVAAGAAGSYGSYRKQKAKNDEAQSSATSAYTSHLKREKAAAEKAAKDARSSGVAHEFSNSNSPRTPDGGERIPFAEPTLF